MKLVTSLLKPLAGEFKLLAVRIDPEISFTKDFVGTYADKRFCRHICSP
jgi:hypothetical protein